MIFLYLLKRDRKDVKLLTVFQGEGPTLRLTSLDDLALPFPWRAALEQQVEAHKMNYDLWMESAEGTHELQIQLRRRGITQAPPINKPIVKLASLGKEGDGIFRPGNRPPRLAQTTLRKLEQKVPRSSL